MDSASGSTRASAQRSVNHCWTNEKEARLISLYGMHRLLWDSRHPEYYKKESREDAMKAIAQCLDDEFDVTNVKDKIKSLRDYFVKELKKEAVSTKSSTARPYVSRWEHFRSWDFLRCVICCDPSVQPPSAGGLSSRPLDEPNCGVKAKHRDVYPVFFDAQGPDMILPSSPEFSSDEDEEQPSSENRGFSSQLPPSPAPPQPVPQASGSNGFPPQHHAPLMQVKVEQGLAPSSPFCPPHSSGKPPIPPQPKRAHPSSSEENHHGASGAGCSDGQTSSAKSPPGPSPMGPCAASFPVGSEPRNSTWMMGSGGGDGGGPLPFHLALPPEDEEELFCRQLLLELRHMERYRRDLVRLRIRQVLFEMKYVNPLSLFLGYGGN